MSKPDDAGIALCNALGKLLLAYRRTLFLAMLDDGGMSIGVEKRKANAAFDDAAKEVCGMFLRERKGK